MEARLTHTVIPRSVGFCAQGFEHSQRSFIINTLTLKQKLMATNTQSDVRVPPHNLDAEQSVLGAIMLDKDAIIAIADMLRPEDFYKGSHGVIYNAILELYSKNDPIDVLSISNRLEEKKKLTEVGGAAYLASLANMVPSASNIAHYAAVVRKKATLRKLIHAATEIGELGYSEEDDVETTLDHAEQKLFSISQQTQKKEFLSMKDALSTAFDRIDDLHKNRGEMRGVPTGFPDVDHILSGLQKSDLIILAARPSVGKTSFALDIARAAAAHHGVPTGIFSLEMGSDQLVDRMIAAEGDVDLWRLRTGNLNDEGDDNDFEKINVAMGRLNDAPIYIDDSSSANIMTMRTMARRLQAQHNLGLIVIDYLQLMEGRSTENRTQEISEISRGLKTLAREINIPIIALSQLSRAVESRQDQRPKLSDLRESGSIEQDADVVMFLYREDRVNPDTENKGVAELIIAKHRNGPVGTANLFFKDDSASYRSLEEHHMTP